MDRKQFMRDVYSDYWLSAREQKYGFMEYDRRLCELVGEVSKPEAQLLEVAVGTGYPIADFLAKAGYRVYGIDISPALVERCRQTNADIVATVGDAERLEFPDESFDTVYCFHSSWYFPDLLKVIDEMLRVTRVGGHVLFDIQNAENPAVAAEHQRRLRQVRPGLLPRLLFQARNVVKVTLRQGNPNWHAVVYQVPAQPQALYEHLRQSPAAEFSVLAREEADQSLQAMPGLGLLTPYPRLVFKVCK